ncbi:MAG: hypothetical protein V7701_17480, partial [Sneathiella sp.]
KQFWKKAASDLNLQITSPYRFLLSSGRKLEAILLIHHFGGARGMLIFGSYDEVAPYIKEIVDAGYGFSILDEPMESEQYNKEDYVDMLVEWGWSGANKTRPSWL